MNKKSIYLSYVFLFLAISLVSVLLFTVTGVSSSTSFADLSLGGELSVTARKDNEIVESDSSTYYSGSVAHVYKWRNIDYLSIVYHYDENNLPPPNNLNEQKYTFKISLEYLQGYLNSTFNPVVFENAYGPYSNRDLASLDQIHSFNINLGMSRTPSGEVNTVTVKGWGIYRFKITINGVEKYSDFVFVEPDYSISTAPVVDRIIVESQNSMRNSYSFFIANEQDFAFIDQKSITWYAKGESEDGTRYALTSSDLDKENFKDCSEALYLDIERTGTSFLFNDNEVNGKWTVWCEYRNQATNEITVSENNIEIETKGPFKLSLVIWVIVSVAVVSLAVVITITVILSKKDKIW